MQNDELVVHGQVTPDGTLKLDAHPGLPVGPVEVVIRALPAQIAAGQIGGNTSNGPAPNWNGQVTVFGRKKRLMRTSRASGRVTNGLRNARRQIDPQRQQ